MNCCHVPVPGKDGGRPPVTRAVARTFRALFWSLLLLPLHSALATADGRAIYEQDCAFCHGIRGEADTPAARVLDPPPRRFADPVEMAGLSDARLLKSIRDGRTNTAMGAWGRVLTGDQIRAVLAYVRRLQRPIPPGMTQAEFDIRVGQRLYRQYCVVCHGLHGRADTIVGRALPVSPRRFADRAAMAKLTDAEMFRAIAYGKPGTAMVPWRALLSPRDIRRLIAFIRSDFHYPVKAAGGSGKAAPARHR